MYASSFTPDYFLGLDFTCGLRLIFGILSTRLQKKVKFRENLENYAEIRCICLNVYLKFGFSILKRKL